MIRFSILLLGLFLVHNLPSVRGDYTYQLRFGESNYSGNAGEYVDVDLWFDEILSNSSPSRLSTEFEDGLSSIGASINYTALSGTVAFIESESDLTTNSFFEAIDINHAPALGLFEFTLLPFGPPAIPYLETAGNPLQPNVFSIKFGSIRFRLGNGEGVTQLDIQNRNAFDTSLVLNPDVSTGYFPLESLPNVGGGSSSITGFSSVPEPSSWLLGGLTSFALCYWRGRKQARRKESRTNCQTQNGRSLKEQSP